MRFYPNPKAEKELISVTSVNDVISKPSLYKWYGTQAARRAVENLEDIKVMLKDQGKLKTVEWIAAGATDVRDNSAARGTRVHSAIEKHIKGMDEFDVREDLRDKREHGMLDGYLQFKDDYELEVLDQELAVCNPEHGWAGRYDARAKCYGSFGEPVVVDWKTGNTGPHSTWALQLAAYAHGTILVDTGEPAPEVSKRQALIVRFYPGSYSTHWLDGKDGRPSLAELYLVFRAARVVWEFENSGRLWN